MKWAMKFPLFDYRETQRKWFGIKGKPWYVFVAVKTHADGEVEVEFYVRDGNSKNATEKSLKYADRFRMISVHNKG